MNRNGLSLHLDMVGIGNTLNFLTQSNSVFRQIGDGMRLEEQFQRRKEGLEDRKSPGCPIDWLLFVKT
jgi:hypothetical protein